MYMGRITPHLKEADGDIVGQREAGCGALFTILLISSDSVIIILQKLLLHSKSIQFSTTSSPITHGKTM